ncbi:hypothetical protein IMZ48_31905 [Candidatus Bathyarchaeota archaeon]|nr:hypothetical protein [Candidatus Bathyarchaeota archaeon]
MSPHSDTPLADSLSKKRERDRRAQQNVRNKRIAQVRALELHTATLESDLRDSRGTCDGLRQEIETLRDRQGSLQHLVASWGHGSDARGGLPSPHPTAHSSMGMTGSGSLPSTPAAAHHSMRDERRHAHEDASIAGEEQSAPPAPIPTAPPSAPMPPRWNMLPVHIPERDIIITNCFSSWLERPDLARASPESPQPLELLYGSKRNFLANNIYETIQQWPCREVERLASGWLAYHMIKWMVQPNEKSFARLREFQHPTPEQLCHPHPYYVDFKSGP